MNLKWFNELNRKWFQTDSVKYEMGLKWIFANSVKQKMGFN